MRDFKIRKDKLGNINELIVPDAHTLYVHSYIKQTSSVDGVVTYRKGPTETMVLASLNELMNFKEVIGPILWKKWAINDKVVSDLISKGEAVHWFPPFRFEYKIRRTKYADELRHKG